MTSKRGDLAKRIAGMHRRSPARGIVLLATAAMVSVLLMPPLDARQAMPAGMCRIDGKATSGGMSLPGVTIVFKAGDAVAAATSTEADGKYAAIVKPGSYRIEVSTPRGRQSLRFWPSPACTITSFESANARGSR